VIAESPAIIRRSFCAAKHPKGSVERGLNLDAVTSEYLPGERYIVRRRAVMSEGTPNPAQRFHDCGFRTKGEAEAHIAAL
jgi:hypothetical protein